MTRIKLGRCKEKLTGRGGFVLFSELWEHLKLSQRLDRSLPQPGSGRGFKPSEVIQNIVSLFLSGGEHLSDIAHLSSDSLLYTLNGSHKAPASNTLTSWLNHCERWVEHDNGGSRENVALHGVRRVNRELLGELARLQKKTSLILDVDATLIKTKKRTATCTYKGFRGYQPQLAYLPELGAFLGSELRPGNMPCSKDALSYLEDCKASMPVGTHIRLLRGDAAYYQRDVLKWLKENRINFTIRAIKDPELKRTIQAIDESEWAPYFDSDGIEQSDTRVASTAHSMDGVGYFRLVVIRRRRDAGDQWDLFDGKYKYHPIATNLKDSTENVVHLYNQRGRMEDGIGQLKGDFGLSAMPCSKFEANALWIVIGILAFTFFVLFKLALGGDWAVRKAKTLRFHILNIPGRLVRHARYVVLELCCSAEFLAFFRDCRTRCLRLVPQFG